MQQVYSAYSYNKNLCWGEVTYSRLNNKEGLLQPEVELGKFQSVSLL